MVDIINEETQVPAKEAKHRDGSKVEGISSEYQKEFIRANFGDLPEPELREVEGHLSLLRVNGSLVALWDIVHTDEAVSPPMETLIKGADRVFMEYFPEEIKRNVGQAGFSLLRKMYSTMQACLSQKTDYARLLYADSIANVCKENDKPVCVADIANNKRYVFQQGLFYLWPGIIGRLTPEMQNVAVTLFQVACYSGTFANIAAFGYQFLFGKGIYDQAGVNRFDKFFLDLEDARRVFVTEGIKRVTKEYPVSHGSDEDYKPELVVFYPQAHNLRIENYLQRGLGRIGDVKEKIYRAVSVGLDVSLRQWEPKKHREIGWQWGQPVTQSNAAKNTRTDG